jgi:DNA-binding CsgD family transcriptional regulator
VGRAPELAALERAVSTAREGTPSAVLVGGDAGIGKSTLVAEAARRTGVTSVVGRCLPMAGALIPLAPVSDMLRDAERSAPGVLDDDPASTPLLEWRQQGSGSATMAPGQLFAQLLGLLSRLGASDAVVVAFEDLHWADPLTWDLFDFLARNLVDEHIVLLGTYRANEVAAHPEPRRRLAELARIPATRRLPLEGFTREEAALKIEALTGEPPRADFVDEILARGQGNPFFTTELVTARLPRGGIPDAVTDVLAAELDALDSVGRSVVDVLAVVGRDTAHELLEDVVDAEPDALEGALRAMIDSRLVVLDHEDDGYRLRHALIAEVAYDALLPPQRARLHHRVAVALANRDPAGATRPDRASELAVHLDRAGDREAAFDALLAAADSSETAAPATALRHLERALELWDSVGRSAATADRGDRLWQAAELASGTVGNEAAAHLARRALECGPPWRGEAWGHERLGRYLWGAGHLDDSAREFSRAADLLAGDSGLDAARVFAGLAQSELMLANFATARERAERVLELLDVLDKDPAAWAMARRVLGIVVDHAGDSARGVELCREAVAAAPNAQTALLAMLYLGVALLDAGQYQDAVNEMLDASADARLTGLDRSFGGYVDALAAEGLVRLGRWSEARTVLDATAGADAFPLGRVRLALVDAVLSARRADAARAVSQLERAGEHTVDPFHQWFVDRASAESALALGNHREAAEICERAVANAPTPLWHARFVMYAVIAEVELALDARARREPLDVDAVTARLSERIGRATRAPREHPSGDISAHLAHAEATLGRLGAPDAAAWANAAEHWAQLRDPYWLATARVREAEAAAASGAAARAVDALRDAHELATHLAAPALLSDIDAVSRRTRLSVDRPVPVVLDGRSMDRLGLTPREAEVLSLVAEGKTNREIGEALFVSEKTASVHVSNILRKLGVTSRVDAAAIAQRLEGA